MNIEKNKKKLVLILFGFYLLAASAVIDKMPIDRCLTIETLHGKRLLGYIVLGKEDTFQIQYTHSIHLSEVKESYKIRPDNKITQVELMYKDTAIGMPANAEEGETFEMKNGEYYIKNMKREFDDIPLSVGQVVSNHRLIFKNKVYPISKFVQPGSFIRIEIRKLSLWEIWRGVNILDNK